MKFKTKLWKRSEKSFASTIPHIALLTMDEEKDHEVVWEYNSDIGKWTFELVPKGKTGRKKTNSKRSKKVLEIKKEIHKENSNIDLSEGDKNE
jgi:hypothetical protein